jgi:hypothetical protein
MAFLWKSWCIGVAATKLAAEKRVMIVEECILTVDLRCGGGSSVSVLRKRRRR